MAWFQLLLLFPLYLVSQSHFPLIIAHRGASAHAPENTLPAFDTAIKFHADAVEIDLRLSKDSQFVVIHDASVERTTNGEGKVNELLLKEIKQLDAGSKFSKEFKGVTIPTLAEALAILDTNNLMIIELKTTGEDIERRALAVIDRSGKRKQVILKSFYPDAIERFFRLAPDIPRIYVFAFHLPSLNFTFGTVPRFENIFAIPATYLQVHRYAVTQSFVQSAQEKNYRVIVWGVDTEEVMKEMIALGVDGIETDFPNLLFHIKSSVSPH